MAKFLGSTEGRFFVPTACRSQRRAQPRSRLAAGHRRRRREAALTAASPALGWSVGTIGRETERRDMILDWACASIRWEPHHLVSGRAGARTI